MCGIAGSFDLSGAPAKTDDAVRMIRALAHRGPDGWGAYASPDGAALLVHTRLSIVDLAQGAQPLSNEDGTVWAVVNGELYDDAKIRTELEARGHRFRTLSDSELVVHLYEELKEAFPTRLRGEFAIALYDERQHTLLLARDRFGIKPLHHLATQEGVTFGSEVKAIFAKRGTPRALHPAGLRDALRGTALLQETVFAGVSTVEPGTIVTFNREAPRGLVRRYWDVPFVSLDEERRDKRTDDALVEAFSERLDEAVRVRLRADVPVGTYLSGGIDSTAVTALTRRALGHSFPAFTVGFEDPAYDESALACVTAEALDIRLEHRRFDAEALDTQLERALWHSEIPVFNGHGAAKNQLAALARQKVKVVLTGEGADEVLAGYGDYRHQQLLDEAQAAPKNRRARQAAARYWRTDVFPSPARGVDAYRDYDRVVTRLGAYPYTAIRLASRDRLTPFLSRGFKDRLGTYDALERLIETIGPSRLTGLSSTSATQYVQMKTTLQSYILNFLGDRQEMAHAIEGRVPFLDHPLVELAASLPTRMKIDHEHGKLILRRAVRGLLPADASERKKKMFLAPTGLIQRGARTELSRAHLSRSALASTGIFNPRAIALASAAARLVARRSWLRLSLELSLTLATSAQVLHHILIDDFETSLERFGRDAVYRGSLERLRGSTVGGGQRLHLCVVSTPEMPPRHLAIESPSERPMLTGS